MRLASPINHVHRNAPPFLIVHGTHDETVPFDQGERLHQALTAAGATTTFIPIEGGHHNLRHNPGLPYDGEVWHDLLGKQTVELFDHNQTG
jgi:dipeptidyl aminopeptidase/acylaminoacyl peptidase